MINASWQRLLQERLQVEADADAVAVVVAQHLQQALQRRQVLGLATGRTMEPVYAAWCNQLLALPAVECARRLAGWRSFNLDEYVGLGASDPASFAAFMHRHLIAPLGLARHQVQLPDGLAADPQQEAQRYATAVAVAGGIDLQLLGLGSNGHIGFNEPPCGADAPCRCLLLSEATRQQNADAFGGDPAAVPQQAITLGTREILSARQLLLVVTGGSKAEILRRTVLMDPQEAVPASWLQQHPGLRIVADQAATARLNLR